MSPAASAATHRKLIPGDHALPSLRICPNLANTLPSGSMAISEVLNRILRYETTIERYFSPAMQQLEHLQQRRSRELALHR
jgi:hypothetical protein